ncbi:hypothetical protein SIID45300_00785 [Candidatus Magnetaquicoccaceae bacterium FCR-1]|uniref:GapR-like DNA-binding domain-containing protein n=1 Tax=Candidatus Magnetaquiglobus chichijimensis TaxID=3141448 RepID=A0ABQ0C6H3_9PROT
MNLKVVEQGQPVPADDVGGISSEELRRVVERIERLEDEKLGIAADIRAIYAEAKAMGFDPKILRKIIRLRAMEPHQIEEEETLIDLYKRALGMPLS